MNKKKYFFISGLPRSGSTLLCNVLAQNPNIYSNGVTSGLVSLLSSVKENWNKNESFRMWEDLEAKKRVLKGIFNSYYSNVENNIIVDKSRGWLAQIEMIEMILGEKPKVIVCVRDMRAIMSSWEKMWRKNKDLFSLDMPPEARATVESRVQFWGSTKSHTGKAYLDIQDAMQRGYKDSMLFVDFDRFTSNPENELKRIYEFIKEPYYKHYFTNIEQKNIEKDPVGWMQNLHVIRKDIIPLKSDWEEVLGAPANGLAKSNALWQNFI